MLLLPVAFFLGGGLNGSSKELVVSTLPPPEEVIATSEPARPSENIEATVLERERLKGEATREPVESTGCRFNQRRSYPHPARALASNHVLEPVLHTFSRHCPASADADTDSFIIF